MQATQTHDASAARESAVVARKLGRLGPYQLQRVIGEGGMGAVYLATQTEPVRRDVAIKVTRVDLGSVGRVARFESERMILATLKHPHIAQVFDAGETEEGFPFMVMEYVDGPTIDRHIDRHRLGLRPRIELFLQACEAVAHAHRNGVIHRDIKPANLVVETGQQRPFVKLIDFGIARLVEGDRRHTHTGAMIGTPEYMSPEQTVGGADIDLRTDVYSLGMTLLHLLTGYLPDDSKTQARTTSRDTVPMSPSRLIATATGEPKVALPDNLSRADLVASLRGDLDWILLKATHRERDQRYGSVGEFAADLRRYLASEPVMAAPPGWFYHARKFVQRHWLESSLALAALVVSVVSAVVVLDAWQRERHARRAADQQLAVHRRFNEFVARVVRTAPAGEDGVVTLDELLARAHAMLDVEMADDPVTRTAMAAMLDRLRQEQAERHAAAVAADGAGS